MHRMIRNMVNRLTQPNSKTWHERLPTSHHRSWLMRAGPSLGIAIAILASGLLSSELVAQGVAQANYDPAASGYVTPAGMPQLGMSPTGMPPMGMPQMGMRGPAVMPAGYNGPGCATGNCDAMSLQPCKDRMVCGSCGGGGGCSCNSMLGRGLLGKLKHGGGMKCLFCRGAGCTACKELPFGHIGSALAGLLHSCGPYQGASICNQRWYDVSVEGLFLGRNNRSAVPSVITTDGVAGTPVLSLSDIGSGDLEAGARVSLAMIWGVGGNLEMTYMGGNKWTDSASANSTTPSLYSFISEFGTNPPASGGNTDDAGFDDTDRSFSQSVIVRSEFHSAELNYRRRTMFPYCRFQSSWLVGLRFLQYRDSLGYATLGDTNNTGNNNGLRFFNSDTTVRNNLFGPQAGYDFWWNACPGLSLGLGSKLAWMQNDVQRKTSIFANSAGIGATPGTATSNDGDRKGVVMGDFELKLVYRFSKSLALRTSYYALAVDNIVYGGLDAASTRDVLQGGNSFAPLTYDSLVVQGFTVGAEYMW